MWSLKVILLSIAALLCLYTIQYWGIFSIILFCIFLYAAHVYYKEDKSIGKKFTVDKNTDDNKKTYEQFIAEKRISHEGNKKGVKLILIVTFILTVLSFYLGFILNISEYQNIFLTFLFVFCISVGIGVLIYSGFIVIN